MGMSCGVDDRRLPGTRISTTTWPQPASRELPRAAFDDPLDGAGSIGLASLAAGLAHDIRNPLTSIKAFVSVLRARKDQPDFLERFERNVGQGIARIEALLDDLAGLARPDGPDGLGDPAGNSLVAVALPDLLSCCFDELGEELAVRGIVRNLSAEEDLPPARGHVARLRKAFVSLLRFSSQAAGPGGTLTLRVARGDVGTLDTCIVDSSPSIAAEHLPYVFEPYYSIGKGRGAGLSLALAHKIVREHGGRIDVANSPGQGTTFRVRLPAWP
ncbi:histidine kinase [Desulfocurvibacter africanus PCS]|uniref:histidine kinase n=1 Tax=Desulfocurvibacter africanus PCS TaxID=1262666 RepID=M5PPQ3_DESAF|nr:HAMP domain-containing sensor histidine kinase [Desulfocurvibacter africanus]EMG36277.1 histidine kinase [Desulfocurvibacter africanus PCS]